MCHSTLEHSSASQTVRFAKLIQVIFLDQYLFEFESLFNLFAKDV